MGSYIAIGRTHLATDFRRVETSGNVAVRNASRALQANQARAKASIILASVIGVVAIVAALAIVVVF